MERILEKTGREIVYLTISIFMALAMLGTAATSLAVLGKYIPGATDNLRILAMVVGITIAVRVISGVNHHCNKRWGIYKQ